jgi:Leucine rich repeat
MAKKLFGSLLKFLGFITIIAGFAAVILTGGYLLLLGVLIIAIGLIVYLIDALIKRQFKSTSKKFQITLSVIYILGFSLYYMNYQEHSSIIFPNNFKSNAGIIFGIKGFPALPKTFLWTKKVELPKNGILITSTREEDMPVWQRYYYTDGSIPKSNAIVWDPNFLYNCISNNNIIKAWLYRVNNDTSLEVQKVITNLSNQINNGQLITLYKTSNKLLVSGKDGQYLDLQGEGLSFLPDVVANLNVNKVYLADNHFESIPTQLFQNKSLQEIYLSANPIKEIPANLYKIKRLKSLLVSSTLIRDIKTDLSKLDSLEYLDISSNKLTILPEQIKTIPNLKWLSIEGNNFTNLSFIDARLEKLETLEVYSNKLKSISNNINYLTNLKELLIFDNQLDSIPDNISSLTRLEKLEIWDNPIKYVSPQIRKLIKLKELRIDDNYLTKEDKIHLKQWLPNCVINYQTRTQ